MKRLLLVLSLISLMIPLASAHTLKINNGIGVLMHVDPNDEPVASEASKIILLIKDSDNKFDLSNCRCYVNISNSNQTLATIPLPGSGRQSILNFTFPQSGAYYITVSGKPTSSGIFQSFQTSFEYYVRSSASEKITTNSKLKDYFPYVFLISALAIILILLLPSFLSKGEKE